MLQKLITIGANAFRRKNFSVMAGKVLLRLKEKSHGRKETHVEEWCRGHAVSGEQFMRNLDADLWLETLDETTIIEDKAWKKLDALGLDLGGGGHYPLLYFFTRYLKAKSVVETGVAAGWSSQAILTALAKNNNNGKLYSSDFPYFRYKNPEKLIGFVVDEDLKKNWKLYIDGDQNNLKEIAAQGGSVDLFHYDSDKSAEGRQFAFEAIEKLLTKDALIIFDDIQDNFHFRDFTKRRNEPYRVFEFEGKYVGLTGPALRKFAHADAA